MPKTATMRAWCPRYGGNGERETGTAISIALGARTADIIRWTLRTGLAPALVGLVAGAVAALILTGALGAQLYAVSPTDPVVFGGVSVVLVVVALLASGGIASGSKEFQGVRALDLGGSRALTP